MIQFRYPSYHPLGKKLNTSDRKNINLLPNKRDMILILFDTD